MRVVFSLMTLVLLVFVGGFVITNMETRVPVTVIETVYPDVRLAFVGIFAVVVGALYTGVIAVAEGAAIRLANHRLEREIQKLENELNYLRTQPVGPALPEPDALSRRDESAWSSSTAGSGADDERPSSAPVYDANGDDEEPDPGDDAYSGRRGV
jgi:uncharacterized membrane protein YciS (DUF1049 family)